MQAESPDEEALVKAAAEFGWTFVGREQQDTEDSASAATGAGARTTVTLKRTHEGGDQALVFFDLLATIPFTSDRKRMSVIVRKRVLPSPSPAARSAGRKRAEGGEAAELGGEEILLYCKGADNIVMDRCAAVADAGSAEIGRDEDFSAAAQLQASKAQMMQQLNSFASDGLRTLVVAKRILSRRELEHFLRSWEAAQSALLDKDALLAEAADSVERNLVIVG